MSPFLKNHRFRFDGELDQDFWRFHDAMKLFDGAQDRLRQLNQLCGTPEFRDAYQRYGAPARYRRYFPRVMAGDVQIAIKLHKVQKGRQKRGAMPDYFPELTALIQSIRRPGKPESASSMRRLAARLVAGVLSNRQAVIGWICATAYRQGMDQFLSILKNGKDQSQRQAALIKLVRLDPVCLHAPGADLTVRVAAIGRDVEFMEELAKALDPARQSREYEDRRNEYALTILGYSLGFQNRPLADWHRFFTYYNRTVKDAPNCQPSWFFPSFHQLDTLRKALDQFKIPYQRRAIGRPRKG